MRGHSSSQDSTVAPAYQQVLLRAPKELPETDPASPLARVLDVDHSGESPAPRADDLHAFDLILLSEPPYHSVDGTPNASNKNGLRGQGSETVSAVLSHTGVPSSYPSRGSGGEGIRTPAVRGDPRLIRPPPYGAEPPHREERGGRDLNPRGLRRPAASNAAAVTILSHPRTSSDYAIALRVLIPSLLCYSIKLAPAGVASP